jgi:hypothetical protein
MSWWRRLIGGAEHAPPDAVRIARGLHLPEWTLVETSAHGGRWRDDAGDLLTLTWTKTTQTADEFSDPAALQARCRRIAQARGAGLVDVALVTGAQGDGYMFVDKKLVPPALQFLGMLVLPATTGSWVWAVMCGERNPTGSREAAVTQELFKAGRLTTESFEKSWAQDPYDPDYRGVDRSTLRYMSDAEEYDERFPKHPLSKVRRELKKLLELELDDGS